MTRFIATAKGLDLVGCPSCHLLCRGQRPGPHQRRICPRCKTVLHVRKPLSIPRTWALLIAAVIFYIPANVLPITTVTSFGSTQSDTILSGVLYFIKTGMWPIAVIIFIASVIVPLAKILILGFLLISVQRRFPGHKRDRTFLYRITEVIGRWSMVDIFVVTILVALVNLGSLASVQAGPAAPFFAAVVVTSMAASMQFDPRLIWDVEPPARKGGAPR